MSCTFETDSHHQKAAHNRLQGHTVVNKQGPPRKLTGGLPLLRQAVVSLRRIAAERTTVDQGTQTDVVGEEPAEVGEPVGDDLVFAPGEFERYVPDVVAMIMEAEDGTDGEENSTHWRLARPPTPHPKLGAEEMELMNDLDEIMDLYNIQ